MRSTIRRHSRLLLALLAIAPLLPLRLCADQQFVDNIMKYNKGYWALAAVQIMFAKNDDEAEVYGNQETITTNSSTVQACTVVLPITPNSTTPGLTNLPGIGGGECQVQCANPDGLAAGACYSGNDYVACEWTPPSNIPNIEHVAASTTWKIATLAKAAGSVSSEALGINASGVVVGLSSSANYTQHAVSWSSSGALTDLNDADGNSSLTLARAVAINNSGQIVGTTSSFHPFLLDHGVATDLGGLGGFFGQASGINNSGQIVGYSDTVSYQEHAFLYENGNMTDLGTLPGGNTSTALAINDSGIIIGSSNLGNGTPHAVVWASNGTIYDINALAPNTTYVYTSATAIDSNGDIFVQGHNNANRQIGILLTVPSGTSSGSAPTINTNPGNLTEPVGAKATFTGSATGSPTPTYQWYFGTKKIAGATSSTYTIAKVAATNAGTYSFVATNSHGSATSKTATLTIPIAPKITGKLTPQTAVSGGNATFSLAATGTPTLHFYWQFSKTTSNYSNVTMTTVSSLTLTGVTSANQGNYRVIVSNAGGTANSTAKLTVKP